METIIKSEISFDEYFMRMVYLVASKSKDPSSKIGAILVKNGNVVSSGFNGLPQKVIDFSSRYLNKEIKYQMVAHAECNSIYYAARHGISTAGASLYTNGLVCCECSKAVIQAGITRIIYHEQFAGMNDKWIKSVEFSKIMLDEAGVKIDIFDKKLGLTALCNGDSIKV